MPRAALTIVLFALAAAPRAATAEDAPAPPDPEPAPAAEPPPRSDAVAIGVAIVPGVLIHGAGHYLRRDDRMARRLVIAEGIGLGLAAAGGLPIAISGGAEETMPGLPLLIAGGGLFLMSWFADLYGAAGGGGRDVAPPRAPATAEVELGYTLVGDPVFDTAHLATVAASGWLDRARLDGGARVGARAWQVEGGLAARILGGRPGAPGRDGRRLDVHGAIAYEALDEADVDLTTVEVAAAGRWDLAPIGASLAGAFVTLELGLGAERVGFDGAGDTDWGGIPIGRFGFGAYLGDGGDRHAEVELYYEHRRDDLAGGLLFEFGGNGFLGRVGAAAHAWRGAWGLAATVEAGSAWVAHAGVRHRFGRAR